LPVALMCVFSLLPVRVFADARSDEQAKALVAKFKAMKVITAWKEDFATKQKQDLFGSTTLGPGKDAADEKHKALVFPKGADPISHVYIPYYLPAKAHISFDFYPVELPGVGQACCLLSVGTGGNTKMAMLFTVKGEVYASISMGNGYRNLTSAPVALKAWHHFDLYYGADGDVLLIDDKVEDFSTESTTTLLVNAADQAYIGNFARYDETTKGNAFNEPFIGSIDNFANERLE